MIKLYAAKTMASNLALAATIAAAALIATASFDLSYARGANGSRGGGSSSGASASSSGAGAGQRDTQPCFAAITCGDRNPPPIRYPVYVRQPAHDTSCRNGTGWTQDMYGSWLRVSCEATQHGYDAFD